MAEVKMDLAELEILKTKHAKDIKGWENKVMEADSKIEELNKVISKLESDSKIVLVKPSNTTGLTYEDLENTVAAYIKDYHNRSSRFESSMRDNSGEILELKENHDYATSHYDCVSPSSFAKRAVSKFKELFNNREVIESYRNLDDVSASIRKGIEEEYAKELGKLRAEKTRFTEKLEEANTSKEEAIQNLIKEHYKEIKEWEEKYSNLKKDKETKTLIDKIKELQDALDKERSKKWYQIF